MMDDTTRKIPVPVICKKEAAALDSLTKCYCERVAEGETRNCQELAAAENYKAKIAGDKAIPIYNKYYKRYAARVRVKQIREADFKKWKYQAITLRNECSAGKITVEEYIYPPLEHVPRRYAIVKRNEWMVRESDTVVAYVLYSWGGAASTLRYAQKHRKQIIGFKRLADA